MFSLLTLVLTAGLLMLLADLTSGIRLDGFGSAFWAALIIYFTGAPLMFVPDLAPALGGSWWIFAAISTGLNLVGLGLAHMFLTGFNLRSIIVAIVAALMITVIELGIPLALMAVLGGLSN